MSNPVTEPRQYLTFFHVPEGEGQVVWTVTYHVLPDGSITLPDFTPVQKSAITAYLTYNNNHMRVHMGNSLTEMSSEETELYTAAIEALKTPGQVHQEKIESFTLSQHSPTITGCRPFISWIDEMWDGHKKDYVEAGDCTQEETLHEVRVTESYDNTFSYRHPQITTQYIVCESTTNQKLSIIQARCNLIDCENYRKDLSE